MPTPTRTIFGTFNTTIINPGDLVQISTSLLEEAVRGSLQVTNTYSGTMRVFNLKDTYGFKYDFHLSFKLDPTSNWAQGNGTHFCARDDAAGKNYCLYWFYELKRKPGGSLGWSYGGGAPDTPQNAAMRDDVAILPTSTSGTPGRLAQRDASAPLGKLLKKLDAMVSTQRAELIQIGGSWSLRHRA